MKLSFKGFKTVMFLKLGSTYGLETIKHTLNVNTAIIPATGFTSQQGHPSKLATLLNLPCAPIMSRADLSAVQGHQILGLTL